MAVNAVLLRGVHVVHLPSGRRGIVQGPEQRYFPDPENVFVHFRWNGDRLGLIPVCELEIVQEQPDEDAVAARPGAGRGARAVGGEPGAAVAARPGEHPVLVERPSLDQHRAGLVTVDVPAPPYSPPSVETPEARDD